MVTYGVKGTFLKLRQGRMNYIFDVNGFTFEGLYKHVVFIRVFSLGGFQKMTI